MKRRAFTLIELLVVIAIIALLVSILLPSLQAVRESARKMTCSANMRSIANAVLIYAAENEDLLVPYTVQPGSLGYGQGEWWANMLVRGENLDAQRADRVHASQDQSVFRCPEGTDELSLVMDNVHGGASAENTRTPDHFGWGYHNLDSGGNPVAIDGVAVRSWYAPNAGNQSWMPFHWRASSANHLHRYSSTNRASELVMVAETAGTNFFWRGARIGGRHRPVTHEGRQGETNIAYFDGSVRAWNTLRFNEDLNADFAGEFAVGETRYPRFFTRNTIFSLEFAR